MSASKGRFFNLCFYFFAFSYSVAHLLFCGTAFYLVAPQKKRPIKGALVMSLLTKN